MDDKLPVQQDELPLAAICAAINGAESWTTVAEWSETSAASAARCCRVKSPLSVLNTLGIASIQPRLDAKRSAKKNGKRLLAKRKTMQITSVSVGALLASLLIAAASAAPPDPVATELWAPEPVKVTPGEGTKPPSDAIVLFDGTDVREWISTDAKPAAPKWPVTDGVLKVQSGSGHIQTQRDFLDYQLHIEWRTPADVVGAGQQRGNSGVFLAATGPALRGYELQVLDCAANKTYVNGQAASIYKQFPPLVNACRSNGEWQSYDILWTAPRFLADGTLQRPARVTALHNGVLVQWNVELKGETLYAGAPRYFAHGRAPIMLQDHGDKGPGVEFRNIWVREVN